MSQYRLGKRPIPQAARLFGAPRHHVHPQNRIHTGLVPFPLRLKPLDHIRIQANGNHLLGARQAQLRVGEKIGVQRRNITAVKVVICQGVYSIPITLRGIVCRS
jgi:hypothetical protein